MATMRCSAATFPAALRQLTQSTARQARSHSVFRNGHELSRQIHRGLQGRIATQNTRRCFSNTTQRRHGHLTPPKPGEERKVTFVDKDGSSHTFEVSDGDNLLDVAQANDLEMEGACGGSCACSTCHLIVQDEEYYDKMEEPSDDENDMLDLAFGLTETSRLGCQIVMSKELDGLVVKLPSMTRNMQASDFAEKK